MTAISEFRQGREFESFPRDLLRYWSFFGPPPKLANIFNPARLDKLNPWGLNYVEPSHGIVRYFAPVDEDSFIRDFNRVRGSYRHSQSQPWSYPKFNADYKEEEGPYTQALREAGRYALKLMMDYGTSGLVVSGLVRRQNLTESFSSWDQPVLLPSNLAVNPDKIIAVRFDRGKFKLHEIFV